MQKNKKALLLTWSGFQDHEVVYPYYRLLGDNFETIIVADKKDALGRFYGILGTNMPCHVLINDFITNYSFYMENFDLLILPGGVKSLEKLRLVPEVLTFIAEWIDRNKIVSSTCHGAQLLISAKRTKDRIISGYYSIKDDIENSGAVYSKEPVVVSGNIISSPHYDHMGIWMETTLREYYK